MTREGGRGGGAARMIEKYRNLIHDFVIGEISADAFEIAFLALYKGDPNQVTGAEFDILDGLFADVDDYVDEPELRARTGGLDADELRQRARDAYAHLYAGDATDVSADLTSYIDLLDRFIGHDITAPAFEAAYLQTMKSESRVLGKPIYFLLQELFEDADAYVARPELRTKAEDLDDEQLRACAVRTRQRLRDNGFD